MKIKAGQNTISEESPSERYLVMLEKESLELRQNLEDISKKNARLLEERDDAAKIYEEERRNMQDRIRK